MPSIRSRLFVLALKYRHLLRFHLKRRTWVSDNTSVPKLRADIEKGAAFFGKLPNDFTLEPVQIGDLSCNAWRRLSRSDPPRWSST